MISGAEVEPRELLKDLGDQLSLSRLKLLSKGFSLFFLSGEQMLEGSLLRQSKTGDSLLQVFWFRDSLRIYLVSFLRLPIILRISC